MKLPAALIIALALPLGGCPSATRGSVAGGDCKIGHTPKYAVKGATSYDQEWIDDEIESLVRGCRQPRPLARPASLDAPPKPTPGPAKPTPTKKHWWQR